MKVKWLTIAATALALPAVTGSALAKHRIHHWHPVRTVVPAPQPTMLQSDEPHMIEVKPGVWISSWGCITDEGQGRWAPCDYGGGRRP